MNQEPGNRGLTAEDRQRIQQQQRAEAARAAEQEEVARQLMERARWGSPEPPTYEAEAPPAVWVVQLLEAFPVHRVLDRPADRVNAGIVLGLMMEQGYIHPYSESAVREAIWWLRGNRWSNVEVAYDMLEILMLRARYTGYPVPWNRDPGPLALRVEGEVTPADSGPQTPPAPQQQQQPPPLPQQQMTQQLQPQQESPASRLARLHREVFPGYANLPELTPGYVEWGQRGLDPPAPSYDGPMLSALGQSFVRDPPGSDEETRDRLDFFLYLGDWMGDNIYTMSRVVADAVRDSIYGSPNTGFWWDTLAGAQYRALVDTLLAEGQPLPGEREPRAEHRRSESPSDALEPPPTRCRQPAQPSPPSPDPWRQPAADGDRLDEKYAHLLAGTRASRERGWYYQEDRGWSEEEPDGDGGSAADNPEEGPQIHGNAAGGSTGLVEREQLEQRQHNSEPVSPVMSSDSSSALALA